MKYSYPVKLQILQRCPGYDGKFDMNADMFWYMETKGSTRGSIRDGSLADHSVDRSVPEVVDRVFALCYAGEVSWDGVSWYRFDPAAYTARTEAFWKKVENVNKVD